MTTATRTHDRPSTSYGFVLLAFWAIAWLCLLSSCATFQGLQQYAAEKAGRLLECQAVDPASMEQAERCLGQYARDLGTQSCKEAQKWLDELPGQHDAAETVDEVRPNE